MPTDTKKDFGNARSTAVGNAQQCIFQVDVPGKPCSHTVETSICGSADLHGKSIAGMATSIDDVEGWHWQNLQHSKHDVSSHIGAHTT